MAQVGSLRRCGMSDEPAAQAHALLERLYECRALVVQLEAGGVSESMSAQAERLLAARGRLEEE